MTKKWSELFNLENPDEKLVEFFSKDTPFAEAFKCLFENASDAIYILDKHGNFVAVNRKAEELTGFKRENFVGRSFRKIIPLKSLPKAIGGFLDVVRGKDVRLELELKTATKKTVLVEVTSKPLIIKGKIVGTLGIVRDITERVSTENRLKEANRRLEMLFNTAMEGITVVDVEENLTFVNKAFADMLGYREDELIGMNVRKLVDENGFEEIRRQTEAGKKGKVSRYELVMYNEVGEPRIVQVSSSPLMEEKGKFTGSLAIVMDVTERKRIEEALIESEERFRKIFENANDGLIYLDTSGRIVDVNEKAVKTFGGSKEELLGKHFIRVGVFSLRDLPKLLSVFARILRGKEGYTSLRIKNKKGEELYLECSSSIIKVDDKLVGILVIARDITERKKMEEKLRESEEKWRSLVKNAPNIIIIVDRDGKIQFINRTVIDASPEEVIGKSIYDFIDPRHHDVVRKTIRQVFQTGEGGSYEISGTGPDGGTSWYATQVGPIKRDGQIVSVTLITIDITERKQMQQKLEEYSQQLEQMVEKRTGQLKEAQEQLIKSERLAAIGQVAAMVGHDLRNPLTSMSGATYYLKTKLGSRMDEKTREMFELIEKDIQHANKIITDLLEYSREIRLEMTETTPKSIIKEALSLVEIPKNVKVIDSTQNKPKIKIDIDKMKRVFANIIKNAVEAMPDGGKLTISTKELDDHVEIMFIDTGIGIAKEVMEKIWTPFFTTKAEGMGLGLPICKRIIEAHGGNISVESSVGKGTTFKVTIPIKPKIEEGGEKVWLNVPESLSSTATKA
jgi:two-component system sporulation sensor kinase A